MPRGYRLLCAALVGWLILIGQHEQGRAAEQESANAKSAGRIVSTINSPHSPRRDQLEQQCYPNSEKGISCDGIAAKAAVDQARYANEQTPLIWWQFGMGAGTTVAAIIAAFFAWRAAFHTKRSADEAKASHISFVESERGHLEIMRVDYGGSGGVVFTVQNVGRALLEITGVLADTETVWPNEPSGPLGDYRVKIPGGETTAIPAGIVVKGGEALACGFVQYRTLGLTDRRTHFGIRTRECVTDAFGQIPPVEILNPIWQPHDT